MEMNDFQKAMREKLDLLRNSAARAANYCCQHEFEGCVLYEDLLKLENAIHEAVAFYVSDVPACNREDIVKMDAESRPLTLSPEQAEVLDRLLEYCWKDEEEDYADCETLNENRREGHIFEALVLLDNALKGIAKAPSGYLSKAEANVVAAEPLYECQNCAKQWTEGQLKPIQHLTQRVEVGEPMPAGECPECGALCHEADDPFCGEQS